jgi:hypothetical protein
MTDTTQAIIPLQAVPNQTLFVQLNGQDCQINVYDKQGIIYLDLYVSNTLIIGGVICQNLNPIVRSVYLGFDGDLAFIDNAGDEDPFYTGLGTRFSLTYLEVS